MVRRLKKYLKEETFLMTYGDGLSDAGDGDDVMGRKESIGTVLFSDISIGNVQKLYSPLPYDVFLLVF